MAASLGDEGTVRLSTERLVRSHSPKIGGSNPPAATMDATAQMQWHSPV
jgi:hypothetical protein